MMFDREVTKWQSHLGVTKLVKDLDDTHVVNIIHHIHQYPRRYSSGLLLFFMEEAKLRNLTQRMQDRATIPYQDEDGQWWAWNYATHEPEIVGREKKS